jgi:prepilin-type N-terminal cleavage/methylation domain-containing protein
MVPRIPGKRKGFSLAEVLVTIAIIAVLAAVVVPSIGSQLKTGDESRVQQDLSNIRSAVEQFLADVRRYPGTVAQLNKAITTSDQDITPTAYTSSQVARWRGPYLTKDPTVSAGTGFDLSINGSFSSATFSLNGSNVSYLVVSIPITTSANAVAIDRRMDDGDVTTGLIRCTGTSAACGTLQYLLMPIQ